MNNSEVHYITYDPDAIWDAMIAEYQAQGGEALYPGDEKEMLLRGVQSALVVMLAGVDTALRMDTLRYAVGEYLDIYGEKRNCPRTDATYAKIRVHWTKAAGATEESVPSGTLVTPDGVTYFALDEAIDLTSGTEGDATATCETAGTAGNCVTEAGSPLNFSADVDGTGDVVAMTGYLTEEGADEEDDDTYRERIRTWGLTAVTTGTKNSYESAARNAHTGIKDALCKQVYAYYDTSAHEWVEYDPDQQTVTGYATRACVGIYLAYDESEVSASAAIAAALSATNDAGRKPLTDMIFVHEGTKVPYTLKVTVGHDGDISEAVEEAVAEYRAWQDYAYTGEWNPERLTAALYQAGAKSVTYTQVSATIEGTTYTTAQRVALPEESPTYFVGDITVTM